MMKLKCFDIIFYALIVYFIGSSFFSSTVFGNDEFQISVDNDTYIISENTPLKVMISSGEYIELLLKKRTIQTYANNGVFFNYNNAMSVSHKKAIGFDIISVKSIEIENDSSFLTIVRYYDNLEHSTIEDNLFKKLEQFVKSRNGTFLYENEKTYRFINNIKRQGREVKYIFDDQQRFDASIYCFEKVGLLFHYNIADKEITETYFTSISNSFKIIP